MTTQVLEGTWEEVLRHGKKLVGRRVRLLVLDDDAAAEPNRRVLDVLNEIHSKQEDLRFTPGENGVEIVKRGRLGEMFDTDPE